MNPYDASNFHDAIIAFFMNQQCLIFMNYFCSDFLNTLNYVITLSSTLIFTTYLNIFVQLTNKKKKICLENTSLILLVDTFPPPSWLSNLPKSRTSQPGPCQFFFFFFISASISSLKSEMIFHHQQKTHWRQIYLYSLQPYCEFYVYFYMATLFQIVSNAS